MLASKCGNTLFDLETGKLIMKNTEFKEGK